MKWLVLVRSLITIFLFSLGGISFGDSVAAKPNAIHTVYIAGNPALSPIEYYDIEEECYKGILPDIYKKISENTGINFAYISPGTQNEQQRLVKNKQVEMVSAHLKGSINFLSEEYSILSFSKDGQEQTVCIGFTNIATKEIVHMIIEELKSISDSELLNLAVSESVTKNISSYIKWCRMIILCLIIVILMLLFFILRNRVTAMRQQQAKLIDSLTGIGNDKYYTYSFQHHVSEISRSLYFVAYISVDIQCIESYLGPTKVEDVQHYASDVLVNASADTDFTARIADGVFAFVFQCPGKETAEQRIKEVLELLNRYDQKVLEQYQIRFHAGIYKIAESAISAETALYNAKQGYSYAIQHKTEYCFSDAKILDQEAFKLRLQRKLLKAFSNKEFRIYLQFIIDAKTGQISGAEGLSRWQNPEEGLLTPNNYIESMETAGIIERLDFFILEKVCQLLEEWNGTEKSKLWLSCNFTRLIISKKDFLGHFFDITNQYVFDRQNLVIELTEDTLAENKLIAYENILACKKAGFQIALDDLGNGYSSFSDLCDYPVDIIKIDRQLISKAVTARGAALIKGMSKLAHDFGIKVLCEGVENKNENDVCSQANCDYIQGFYYSRVLPIEVAMDFLNESIK